MSQDIGDSRTYEKLVRLSSPRGMPVKGGR
jgi:hypothetical protein